MTTWTEAISPISGVPSPWAFVSVWGSWLSPWLSSTFCHRTLRLKWGGRPGRPTFLFALSFCIPSTCLPAANQWPKALCAAYISIHRRSSASSRSSTPTNKRLHLSRLVFSLRRSLFPRLFLWHVFVLSCVAFENFRSLIWRKQARQML